MPPRKNTTNKQLEEQLQSFQDEFTAEMNELKEFSHTLADALEILSDNLSLAMTELTDIITILQRLENIYKKDQQLDYM